MNCDGVWVPPLTETVHNILREARVIANRRKDKYVRMLYVEMAIYNETERCKRTLGSGRSDTDRPDPGKSHEGETIS
jgi:hypothetical protein